MDIFDHAMQLEKEGETYYRELAGKCGSEGLKSILEWLADEEVRHYGLFEKMKEGASPELRESVLLPGAKDIFSKMAGKSEKFDLQVSQLALYRKAQEIEKASEEYYLQKAKEVKLSYQRDMFNKVAEEEKKHYFLIDNIIEFLSRPEAWLENAEFNHLDEY